MGRASIFLEDLDSRGTLVDRVPSGQRGGVANYSGHNMRVGDFCRFLNLAQAHGSESAPGEPSCGGLNDAERGLAARLLGAGAIRTEPASGAFAVGLGGSRSSHGHRQSGAKHAKHGDWHGGGPVIAAVAGSSDAAETPTPYCTAMHMVFTATTRLRVRVARFWETEVDADEKRTWIEFLRDLRYDVTDEELVVNELQAYMCTERRMFGNGELGGAAVAGSRSSGSDRRKKNSGGAASGGTVDALAALQRRFASAAREWLPAPPSVGRSARWCGNKEIQEPNASSNASSSPQNGQI